LENTDQVLWFAFSEEGLLVGREDPVGVPLAASLEDLGLVATFEQEIGKLDKHRCFAVDLMPEAEAPEGMVLRDLRGMWSADKAFFTMAGRAKQIVEWNRTHRFCGRDGAETVPGPTELSKECPRCGMLYYPRLSPAVIVLVRRGDECDDGICHGTTCDSDPEAYVRHASSATPSATMRENQKGEHLAREGA